MIFRSSSLFFLILFASAVVATATPPTSLYQTERKKPVSPPQRKYAADEIDIVASAQTHKKLGDQYNAKEDQQSAADEYLKALALDRKGFTIAERQQMAVRISWADRLADATRELQLILDEAPDNVEARVILARVMSWNGKTSSAIAEINKVLSREPDHAEALLVKANALRWSGDNGGALPIYRKLLAAKDDFDARLGFAHALLSRGNPGEAREQARLLKPAYSYQVKEQKKLEEALDKAEEISVSAQFSHYADTDDNRSDRFNVSTGFKFKNLDLGGTYTHADVRDLSRKNTAEEFAVRGYGRITDFLGLGAGAGLSQLKGVETGNLLTWNLRSNLNLIKGELGASVGRDALSDTAQLVENKISVVSTSVYLEQNLTDRVSVSGNISRRSFSDNNNANGVLGAIRYALPVKTPTLAAGYRFRFMNFKRNSGSGYFDPQDFYSHQVFATSSLEKGSFSLFVSPYGGYQSYKRNNESHREWIGGVSGTMGYRIARRFSVEGNGEFGNFALGTVAGFRYYVLGVKGLVSF